MGTKPSLLDAVREAVRGPGWAPGRRSSGGRMPSLGGATGWLGSPPLTADGLRGSVVAVDFWTYTCINWLRTVPYVRAWHEAYRDAGLVVLGVHTPEFPFERDVDNVRRAIQSRRIGFPVAVDSDYAIWTAFTNMYWPALYLVDAEGEIRWSHFGEGAYEESEQMIRRLLTEAGRGDALPEPVTVEAHGIEAPADWATLRSAENYLGSERTDNFASPERGGTGSSRRYSVPARLAPGDWALSGRWTVLRDAVRLDEPGGSVSCRFSARDVHLVMTPGVGGTPVRFGVRLDGLPPGADSGDDVDPDGTGTLSEPRLYQLIRRRGAVRDGTFEITFRDPGVQAFAFTFG
jgi:thiol-disulfide isomerase/thioredoxin